MTTWHDQPGFTGGEDGALLNIVAGLSTVTLTSGYDDVFPNHKKQYRVTIGNLFGSDSLFFFDVDEALIMFQKQIDGLNKEMAA